MAEKYYLLEEQREDINYLHRSQVFVTFSSLIVFLVNLGILKLGDFEIVRIIKKKSGFSKRI